MARYLLDTDVIIDYLKGRAATVALVEGLYQGGHELAVCCINVAELYSGLTEREREKAAELVDAMAYLEVTRKAAQRAGEYRHSLARKGIQLSTTDVIIAAAALEQGATLVTRNTAHYPMEELPLLSPPR